MQNHVVVLKSDVPRSFRTQKAADSVNLRIEEKSTHRLQVSADLAAPYSVGLIVGNSGSGKTTLARQIFGSEWESPIVDKSKPIIDQFPEHFTYEECAQALTGIGLTSIPCWVRPAFTLSNGQTARAEAALRLAKSDGPIVFDEWTSVVDRTVAKVMSYSVQKYARKTQRQVVLLSCHYDVAEWLNPDWIIDCNTQTYEDRRSKVGAFERTDRLRFDVRPCDKRSWSNFSKYHYLSAKLPGGTLFTYGLFEGDKQIGFQCFACYSMTDRKLYHSNRVVVHPDYVGLGLGIRMATEGALDMARKGYRVKAKLTSLAMVKARRGHPNWRLREVRRMVTRADNSPIRSTLKISGASRDASKLQNVKYYFYDFVS